MSNKKRNVYLKLGLTLFLAGSGCIFFYYLIFHGEDLSDIKDAVIRVLLPIIDGFVIAYILSPVQNSLEKNVFAPLIGKISSSIDKKKAEKAAIKAETATEEVKSSKIGLIWKNICDFIKRALRSKNEKKGNNKNHKKLIRAISTAFTLILFLAILTAMILLIVPEVLDSLQIIISRFPMYLNKMDSMTSEFLKKYPDVNKLFDDYWPQIEEWFLKTFLPSTSSVVSSVSSGLWGGVVSFLRVTFNFLIGIIISVYLLYSKELFCAQAKKIIYALMKEESANNLINNVRYTNRTFGGFISGKLIDSLLIGIICFIGMSILKIPYALLISVIVGVTNVIPYFGPFLGAIPSAIILFMINPMKCIVFLIFVLILQQFDGNVLGPKILGDSTGLSSFWVIFAITVFGGMFNVFGMFIGVPLFAVIYATIRTVINQRLIKRDLPADTTYYLSSDYHSDSQDSANTGTEIKFAKKTFSKIRKLFDDNKEEDPDIDKAKKSNKNLDEYDGE